MNHDVLETMKYIYQVFTKTEYWNLYQHSYLIGCEIFHDISSRNLHMEDMSQIYGQISEMGYE